MWLPLSFLQVVHRLMILRTTSWAPIIHIPPDRIAADVSCRPWCFAIVWKYSAIRLETWLSLGTSIGWRPPRSIPARLSLLPTRIIKEWGQSVKWALLAYSDIGCAIILCYLKFFSSSVKDWPWSSFKINISASCYYSRVGLLGGSPLELSGWSVVFLELKALTYHCLPGWQLFAWELTNLRNGRTYCDYVHWLRRCRPPCAPQGRLCSKAATAILNKHVLLDSSLERILPVTGISDHGTSGFSQFYQLGLNEKRCLQGFRA